jgi:hypothetical protein
MKKDQTKQPLDDTQPPVMTPGMIGLCIGGSMNPFAGIGDDGEEDIVPSIAFNTTYDTNDQITSAVLSIEIPLSPIGSTAFFSPRDKPGGPLHTINFGEIGLMANQSIFAGPTDTSNLPEIHTSIDSAGTGYINVRVPIVIAEKRESINLTFLRTDEQDGRGKKGVQE